MNVLPDYPKRRANYRAKMKLTIWCIFIFLKRKYSTAFYFFAETKMFQLITGIFGMLRTHYIVCQKRQRMKRRWVIMPVPVLAVTKPLQAGNTLWSLFWNLCWSKSSWLENPCSCWRIFNAKMALRSRLHQGVRCQFVKCHAVGYLIAWMYSM